MNPEELFEKLISNKISRAEFEHLLDGLDDNDILARYEVYLQAQFEKEVNKSFENSKEVTPKLYKKLTITKSSKSKDKKKKHRGNLPIAAVFVLFVGLVFSAWFILSQNSKNYEHDGLAKTTLLPELINKTTPKGRKFRMTLDDGSFVHMNSASKITYPNKFNNNIRDIEILGEVYFDISRDELRPFNIKVKDYTVQVLGTSFNVQAYEDEEDFSVTVESGSVRIILDEHGKNEFVLEKNQKLLFNPTTNLTEVVDVISSEDLSWRAGTLKFDSTPMSKVEKILERWYGVEIEVVGSTLRKTSINGVHKNKNLKSVLEALSYATRSSYIIKDNSIIIKN